MYMKIHRETYYFMQIVDINKNVAINKLIYVSLVNNKVGGEISHRQIQSECCLDLGFCAYI